MIMKENSIHLVTDMLYDFIDGSMACLNSSNAVINSIKHINENPNQPVIYINDSHPENHSSFIENGGPWPPHCIKGTKGQQIHEKFYLEISTRENRPSILNTFVKGESPNLEQYSGFYAKCADGKSLQKFLKESNIKNVVISGIASEYCIFETVSDLLNNNYTVFVAEEALAYVTLEGHNESILKLKAKGAVII